ncbi:MAG: PadR family transcriptional regulator, partial [Candidatus Heimdallarchaeota archaeon]
EKSLTPLELLVLAVIESNESSTPSQVIHRITSAFSNYQPQRGTIYPILHRLAKDEFLEHTEVGKKTFARTKLGSHALLLSIETLLDSFQHTIEYFKIISDSTVSEDPEGAKDIIKTVQGSILQLHGDLQKLSNDISKKVEDEWYDVPLS